MSAFDPKRLFRFPESGPLTIKVKGGALLRRDRRVRDHLSGPREETIGVDRGT